MQSASCRCTVLNSSLMLSVSVCPCICLPFPLPHTLIVGHYAQYAAFIECPVYSGYIAGGGPVLVDLISITERLFTVLLFHSFWLL